MADAGKATRELAAQLFLTSAAPALVQRVARLLLPRGIPVMPLKGVLLQKLVYGDQIFRPIADVDLVVPEHRFFEARSAMAAAGFSDARWETGRWQVTLRDPAGPPLGVDLHRRLSRTFRSRLTASGLFERGTSDTRLFGASVVLPSAPDIFAHLLLHAALHWIAVGRLHNPADFARVADKLPLEVNACAQHLTKQGLIPHALVVLPLVVRDTDDHFIKRLLVGLGSTGKAQATARIVRSLCDQFAVGHPARRLASLALTPSLSAALASAVADRIRSRR